jgi:hypothetical protein
MRHDSNADRRLEKLARDAALEIAGPDAFEQVEVETGVDLDDRPAYQFTFLINQALATQRAGQVRIRRGEHRPLIRILSNSDW